MDNNTLNVESFYPLGDWRPELPEPLRLVQGRDEKWIDCKYEAPITIDFQPPPAKVEALKQYIRENRERGGSIRPVLEMP